MQHDWRMDYDALLPAPLGCTPTNIEVAVAIDTAVFYGTDPTARRADVNNDNECFYAQESDPQRCSVGRHLNLVAMSDDDYEELNQMDAGEAIKRYGLLDPRLHHCRIDFWKKLQNFHDNPSHFDERRGLTPKGWVSLASALTFAFKGSSEIVYDYRVMEAIRTADERLTKARTEHWGGNQGPFVQAGVQAGAPDRDEISWQATAHRAYDNEMLARIAKVEKDVVRALHEADLARTESRRSLDTLKEMRLTLDQL